LRSGQAERHSEHNDEKRDGDQLFETVVDVLQL
jgi:hypothetical protein